MRTYRVVAFLAGCILLLGACGPAPSDPPDGPPSVPQPVALEASRASVATPRIRAAAPLLANGVKLSAVSIERVVGIWRVPNGSEPPKLSLDTENAYGVQMPMLLTGAKREGGRDAWLEVLLPIRPNGASGWVRASDVELIPQKEKIVVDLSDRILRHFRDGKLVHRFSVGIGGSEYPTATGMFYVMIRVPQNDSSGPYGVFALGLSGFSEVLRNWPGGGRMAIHGTADAGDRGVLVSHGCIRVYNPDMVKLKRIPLGTPVLIRR